MNFKKLIKLLKAHYEDSVSEFAHTDDAELKDTTPEIGPFKEVDQHGGEGEGEDWWSVKHFTDHNIFIKVSGNYQSHNGTDFEDWEDAVKEVKPKEKVVTVYE